MKSVERQTQMLQDIYPAWLIQEGGLDRKARGLEEEKRNNVVEKQTGFVLFVAVCLGFLHIIKAKKYSKSSSELCCHINPAAQDGGQVKSSPVVLWEAPPYAQAC